jgi:hypothetical protein
MARGIQRVAGRLPSFEILTDLAAAERSSARALSAGRCHDRFASCHEPGRKVTRRFGDGCYSLPWRAGLRTEESTRRRVGPSLVGVSAGRTACSASGERSGGTGSPGAASGSVAVRRSPIRPVLKHGPRSLTCARVTRFYET